ncbi:type II secretion system protein [Limnohabitans sp.]|uniref:type II secretion system protein n=1 Tax=Limnohabitans sp. TaxID=1907725 RepID=UPI00286F674E|nr:type II secretion system protein [Limnohabitans sp.]
MKINSQIKQIGKQAGYTLIELSIAIAIISVLIMSALFGVQKILDNNNADTTAQQVTAATANITKYATMMSDKLFLASVAAVAPMGVWPENVVLNTGTVAAPVWKLRNPFGGDYIVGSTTTGYFIGITNLSTNACLSLGASLNNAAMQIDTDEVATYTAATTAMPTTGLLNVKPLGGKATSATLSTGCAATAAGKKKNVFVQYAL